MLSPHTLLPCGGVAGRNNQMLVMKFLQKCGHDEGQLSLLTIQV